MWFFTKSRCFKILCGISIIDIRVITTLIYTQGVGEIKPKWTWKALCQMKTNKLRNLNFRMVQTRPLFFFLHPDYLDNPYHSIVHSYPVVRFSCTTKFSMCDLVLFGSLAWTKKEENVHTSFIAYVRKNN